MKEKALAAMLALALVGGAGYLAVTSTGAEAGRSDPVGIPDGNPSKHPEDGDGVCEKGETVVKTTPSGKQVNVPCQAAGHGDDDGEGGGEEASDDGGGNHGNGNGNGNGNGKGKGKN